jgi:hypothetical protein
MAMGAGSKTFRRGRTSLAAAVGCGVLVLVPPVTSAVPMALDDGLRVQLGLDIDGEAAGDEAGYSVALSANGATAIIGAPANDGGGGNSGHARVYHWTGTSWQQRGSDINGESDGDNSGHSVGLSADGATAIIGAPYNDDADANAGHARVYVWNGVSWQQRGSDIDGEAAGDRSGWSVALSADGATAIIGARENDGGGSDAGQARVYVWNGVSWQQRGNDIDGEAAGDNSGFSVGLSADGTTAIIGAIGNDGAGTNAGHARVYVWTGAAWQQRGSDIDGEAADDQSGWSVGLSKDGTTAIIGAPLNDGGGLNAGHARVYVWNGVGWQQRGSDIDGEAAGDLSGYSVGLSANGATAIIGAPFNDGGGLDAGHARVYGWNGASWQQRGSDIDGDAFEDSSGMSVGLSADGATAIVGAPYDDGGGLDAGHARVFRLTPSFVPLTPARVLDTRAGARVGNAAGTGSPLTLSLFGKGGLPAGGIGAVALNVTVVSGENPTLGGGYVTVYPCGTLPDASNLNFITGQTIPNSVIAPVSAAGTVCFFVYGTAHLLADVSGYFPAGTGFSSLTPARVLDTRSGARVGNAAGTGTPLTLSLFGKGGLPASGIGAVALNVTVVSGENPTLGGGYVTVYPCGTLPDASNLNFTTGQTIPNSVIAPVSATGTVCFYVYGTAHLLADVSGYFPAGTGFSSLTPARVLDTRSGAKVGNAAGTGTPLTLSLFGKGGLPASGIGAVALNVTVVSGENPTIGGGYVTVYPCGTLPDASNLNFTTGQTIPNSVIAPVSAAGTVCFYVYGTAHLLADVSGYFTG